jgi:RNA polymerase sigma-70 factor (ECF subfamily)
MSTFDRLALHQLYSENNGWLKSWLRTRLGNAADASDLAHDTFLRVS